jgi:Flp pilus assembly protein TadD
VALKDKYAAPYATLGAIALIAGDYAKLQTYSLQCLAYDPQSAWCHNNLGLSYVLSGQKEAGLVELEKAVALDPMNFTINDNLKRAKAAP